MHGDWGSLDVTQSYATGNVTATGSTDLSAGGLIGKNHTSGDMTVSDSYWDIDTTGQTSSADGTGLNTSEMKGSAAKSNMTGFEFSGVWGVETSALLSYPYLQTNTQSPKPGLVDAKAPSISAFSLSNPSDKNLKVTLSTDEVLTNIEVSITGAESATLSTGDFTETDNGDGTYTYEATYSGSTEGDYTATLETAEDATGNDGANSESDTVTTDTTAPSISSFGASNPSGQDVTVSFDSDEQLSTISVSISGAETATLSTSEFIETNNAGTYTYEATYRGSTAGTYDATLDSAKDSTGNDGATGQSDSVTLDTAEALFERTNLTVEPDDISVGESVTVSLDIENVGDASGSYRIAVEVNDTREFSEVRGSLSPGEQVSDSIELTLTDPGKRKISVRGMNDTPKAQIVNVTQPTGDVSINDYSLNTTTLTAGETLALTATLDNNGDVAGSLDVPFVVNDTTVDNTTVDVPANDRRTVTFTYTFDTTGEFAVTVGELNVTTVTVTTSAVKFDVQGISTKKTIVDGEEAVVNATITNVGSTNGTDTVEFLVQSPLAKYTDETDSIAIGGLRDAIDDVISGNLSTKLFIDVINAFITGEQISPIVETSQRLELDTGQSSSVSFSYTVADIDADELEIRVRTTASEATETITVTDSPSITDYANENGVVDIDGFRAGIDDFVNGEIEIDLFRALINAFLSGDPVTE
jgi:hypothetical protein